MLIRPPETAGLSKRDLLFLDQSGELGGAELCLLSIVQHLRSASRVGLLTDGAFRETLIKAGIDNVLIKVPDVVLNVRRSGNLIQMAWAVPGSAIAIFRIAALARMAKVIYANTQKAFVMGVLAGWVARRPVIWHLHDILNHEHFAGGLQKLVISLANKFAPKIIVNSHATLRSFVLAGGDPSRAVVIWNGLDLEPFCSVLETEVAQVRANLRADGNSLVGVFGRLAPWKGQHVLLEALKMLPGVHAVIVGAPLYGEHDYASRLHRLVEKLGISERVHFLGFRNDIPTVMRAMDVIVHTSTASEPFGRVIVEGMLSGRPVIATLGGGTDEIISDGIDGILVPGNDPNALAGAINSVLDSSAWRERLIVTARQRARSDFSLRRMLDSIDRVIDDVLVSAT